MSSHEESKLSDAQPQQQASPQMAKWFWQSDEDPWKYEDSTKWNWKPYSSEQSDIIENTYIQGQKVVGLGNYQIDLENKLQFHKKDSNKVRRVKREVNITSQRRLAYELSEPIPIEKIQQTINPAFGTVQHFLDFIMKRTNETYLIFQRLRKLKLECKRDEFIDVIQAVVQCIERAAENHGKITKSDLSIQQARLILDMIEAKSNNPEITLKEFLKLVLKVYTEESFVCYWLNELLRRENWVEINVFTPYLVCLACTFLNKDYIIPYQEAPGLMGKVNSLFGTQKLILYRGTALKEQQLKLYKPDKAKLFSTTKLFSWNGVTSTSRNKAQALIFVESSVIKAKAESEKKLGVLFIIEADFASQADGEGMIDISKDSFYPEEEEVILAPGSVFEVIDFPKKQVNNIYEVKLALRKNFDKDQKILGVVQNKIIRKDKAILRGFAHEDVIKGLPLIKGNQLVESLDIEKCVLNSHLLELIDETRKTTKIKEDRIVVRKNNITVDRLISLCYYFPSTNLGQLCLENIITVQTDMQNLVKSKNQKHIVKKILLEQTHIKTLLNKNLLHHLCKEISSHVELIHLKLEIKTLLSSEDHLVDLITSLQKLVNLEYLSLDLASNRFVSDQALKCIPNIDSDISSGILKKLELNFQDCSKITDTGIEYLANSLKSFTSLTYLHLDFFSCKNISDVGISRLKNALKLQTSLTYLHLDLNDCNKISDKGIENLQDALKLLGSLTHLHLDFGFCEKISDKGLDNLKEGLKWLFYLTHLHLDFSRCENISDVGIDNLKDALKPLTLLTYLHLDFRHCPNISDVGIDKLKDSLKLLTSLTHLHLHFGFCDKISDVGVARLKDALKLLTSLRYMYLELNDCSKISGEGIDKLKDALKLLKSLTFLYLGFRGSDKTSFVSIENLADGLKPLNSLTHLHLAFEKSSMVSNGGLEKFKDGLISLASLTNLHLEFRQCSNISEIGLDKLKDGLKSLTSLTRLNLNFELCKNIPDKGLEKLKGAFKSLTSLKYLQLDLNDCEKISDDGIDKLKDGLKSIGPLTHLQLNFSRCINITDKGIDKLKDGLKSLNSLTHLHLEFRSCYAISDKGMKKLRDGLMPLSSLVNLHLDFGSCAISDKGIEKLKEGLKSLNSLRHLQLCFRRCIKISNQGIDEFKDTLMSLTSLAHLHLDLGYCKNISDEGIDNLKEALKLLSSLDYLFLDFKECQISVKGIEKLKGVLKSLTALIHLHLDFSFCNQISHKDIDNLKDFFAYIPTLQIAR